MSEEMANTGRMSRDVGKTSVGIASGETNSDALALGGAAWGSFQIPATFTSATVEVEYSIDGSNWTSVPELTGETNPITVTTNGTYPLPAQTFCAKFARLVSAGAEGAARTIQIWLRG